MGEGSRLTFPKAMRLSRDREYDNVYKNGLRKHIGPLLIFALPNKREHSRLGLSVPRRVGTAVQRNRIKRRLREAFRLSQHDMPGSYDLVISVRPHEPLPLADYQQMWSTAVNALHRRWTNERSRTSSSSGSTATGRPSPAES